MRHVLTKQLPIFAVTVLTMSAAMASSAWADCSQQQQETPVQHCLSGREDRAPGPDPSTQPLGEIIRRDTGTLMDHSGIERGNSNNGYTTAGNPRDENGVAHVDYKDVAKQPGRVDYKDLNISPGQIILNALSAADDAAIASAATHNWTWNGAPEVNLGTGNYRVTGSNFKFNENGTIDFTRTIGGDPSTATHVHYNPHNRTAVSRGGSAAPHAPQEGPGSLTLINHKTGQVTTTPTSLSNGTPGTGAAKRAELRKDPAKLAAAQAAARAAAAAPSALHTPHPKPATTPATPPMVSGASSGPKSPTSPPTQQVLTSMRAPSPIR